MLGILKYIVGDIFIHPAVIKFFGELDLIIKYEEIVGRFHLYAFVKTKLQRKSEIRKIGVKVLADRRFREADKKTGSNGKCDRGHRIPEWNRNVWQTSRRVSSPSRLPSTDSIHGNLRYSFVCT